MKHLSLRRQALQVLLLSDPAAKVQATRVLGSCLSPDPDETLDEPGTGLPGRPERPEHVPASQVPARSPGSTQGRAALLHSLAHIEFNAINLALDAIWRFSGMPAGYYTDWLQVATEEALHFDLLSSHLAVLGYHYGDFPAHNGLWDMAYRTRSDVLARMALVPRTLEARGLDASPVIREKLASAGDHRAAEVIDIILRDEIGHVAMGNHWYRYICQQRGLDPEVTYDALARQYRAPRLRGPFNMPARRQAGFSEPELRALEQAGSSGQPT